MVGFRTVQFAGLQGFGSGVASLTEDGQVLGGDSSFTYIGTYTRNLESIAAAIHVKRYSSDIPGVIGMDEFDMQLTGVLQASLPVVEGVVPGTAIRLSATMTKQK
jgi:hypothetical protein